MALIPKLWICSVFAYACVSEQENCKSQKARGMKIDIWSLYQNCWSESNFAPNQLTGFWFCLCAGEHDNSKTKCAKSMKLGTF